MLLRTHYVFTTGLLTFLGTLATREPVLSVVFAGLVSVLANSLIDYLGHEVRGSFVARTPRTHTWLRSVAWGSIATAFAMGLIGYIVHGLRLGDLVALATISTVLAGPSHMLLDVFTEKGIYVKRDGKWTRFALAHFRYNDPLANGLASLIGVSLIFATTLLV
jgi:uncharacterized membrane protein